MPRQELGAILVAAVPAAAADAAHLTTFFAAYGLEITLSKLRCTVTQASLL